jgi:hypothetical protein
MHIARSIRILAAIAVPWNAIGFIIFLSDIGVIAGGGPPAGGIEAPFVIKVCFAVGTVAGLVGSAGLALLRKVSRPLLWISLFALVVDWGWVFGFSGAASIPIGVAVLAIAVLLVVLVEVAHRRSLLA